MNECKKKKNLKINQNMNRIHVFNRPTKEKIKKTKNSTKNYEENNTKIDQK